MNTFDFDKTKEEFFELKSLQEKGDTSKIWKLLENIDVQRKNLDLREKKLRKSLIICGNNKLRKALNQ